MMNVFAQPSRLRRVACSPRGCSLRVSPGSVRSTLIATSAISGALLLSGTAWADCTPAPANAPANTTVTCDGASASYTNANSGLTVNADATTVMVAPLVIGDNGTLTVASGGSIQGSTAIPSVQFGNTAAITNNGTITSTSAASGAAAIVVGTNSTVVNNGTLTAAAGAPAVAFVAPGFTSTNGTFVNGPTAPAAVTGNILFGYNSGANVGTFTNAFNTTTTATSTATYGLTGGVAGNGNLKIDNQGQWTGSLVQTALVSLALPSSVAFTNGVSANFSGVIQTGDTTTLVNNATGNNLAGVAYGMLLGNGSALGISTGTALSRFTNNGTLFIGTTAAPALVTINGSFQQSATGVLNMAIAASGSVVTGAASQPYSQIDAVGGTAALAGTLKVSIAAGFYPVNSKYNLIVADQGITGSFGAVSVVNANGATLPFITFVNNGIQNTATVADPTQQSYQFEVNRVGTYATGIASVATPNQIAVATALNPIVAFAELPANSATTEAALIGQIDQLTVAQATTLFDEMSPAGLLSYANALRDQANNFERQIALRIGDQNSDHAEDGWWGTVNGQVDVSKATTDSAKQSLIGFNLGYDLSGPHHVFGIAGNASFDSLHNAGSTLKGKNRDFAIAGYGGYDAGPVHLTGQVAYNFGHLSTTRTLTLGTVVNSATGKASEHLFKATGTAGFMLHAGGYTFEPFGGVDYMRGKINGFTEVGNGAAALTVLPINADRTDLLAGLSLTRSSGKLRPYLRAVYRSEVGHSGDSTVSAYFDANTATAFTVAGVPASRHEEDINAGVNLVFEDAGSLFIGYQGTLRSGFSSHGINLGIRLEF